MNGEKLSVQLISYSSQYNTTYAASKAIDGTTSSYWRSANSPSYPQSIVLKVTGVISVNGIRYYGTTSSYRPTKIEVYVSQDNDTYTKIGEIEGHNAANWKEQDFDNETYIKDPYIRLDFTGANTSRLYVYDVEIYGSELVQKTKWLIYDEGVFYNAEGNSVEIDNLSSQAFLNFGSNAPPTSAVLMSFSEPTVYRWSNYEADVFTIKETATPYAQTIYSKNYDMSDETIKGIEKVIIVSEGSPVFAVSFDNGYSWKMYTENGWGTITDDRSGMSADTVNALHAEDWNSIATTGKIKWRTYIPDSISSIQSIIVDFIN